MGQVEEEEEDGPWTSASRLPKEACSTESKVEVAEEEEAAVTKAEEQEPDAAKVQEIETGRDAAMSRVRRRSISTDTSLASATTDVAIESDLDRP